MRIVVYNFVQPDASSSKQGGGVTVYQKNLIKALQENGHDVIVMSSGDRYSLTPAIPSLIFSVDNLKRAIIANSPMLAPAHFSFYQIDRYYSDDKLDHIPLQLKEKYGNVDVFHFQNVEGLTAGFLKALRRTYPLARILLSAHNYNLVCPQVNLWHREHENCENYRNGNACVNCLVSGDRHAAMLNLRRMEGLLSSLGIGPSRIARMVEWLVRSPFKMKRALRAVFSNRRKPASKTLPIVITNPKIADVYRRYRETNIELASEVFDDIIAVSERTRQVLIDRGVPAKKIGVSYIGTAHHAKFQNSIKMGEADGHIHLAYLGYMRADKGFFFFLDALGILSDNLARNLSVTIAAPLWDHHVVERLRGLAYKFRQIRMFDGYSHDNLDDVLDGVNLGIVPVLWEDNLPQVAIEMVSRGIPILTSDRGGSHEIGSNKDFIFKSGSKPEFSRRLQQLVSGEVSLSSFWNAKTKIFSMNEHISDLMRFYTPTKHAGSEADPAASRSAALKKLADLQC